MKRIHAACLALLIVALGLALAVPASASEAGRGDTRYNLAVVVDASGSLGPNDTADPTGLRYAALSYLLGMLTTQGHEIGALVFSDTVKTVSEILPIQSEEEKKAIFELVKAETPAGYTNIGEALMAAVDQLQAVQQRQMAATGSHLQSEVILFTDGVTEMPTPAGKQDSLAAKEQAIALAKTNGIRVSGVFLNDSGAITDNREVFDIVRDVRGNAGDPVSPDAEVAPESDFNEYYAEIQSADDIATKFTEIARRLSAGGIVAEEPEPVPLTKSVIIPGIGVSELNFGLRYNLGVKDQIVVYIRDPGGEVTTEAGGSGISVTKEDTTFIAKIQKPLPGRWEIRVEKAGDVPVEVMADIIISSNVAAKVAMQAPDGKAKVGEPVSFQSHLEVEGVAVKEDAKYEGYACTLTLVSEKTGESKEYPMKLDGGSFEVKVPVEEYSGYTAYATYRCENIEFRSDDIMVRPINQPPEVTDVQAKYSYTIFNDGLYTLELSAYASDPEGESLTFTPGESSYAENGITLDTESGSLSIDTGKTKGVVSVRVIVSDNEQAVSEMTVELAVQNGNWLYIVILAAILLVAAGVAFFIMQMIGKVRVGPFQLKLEEDDEEIASARDLLSGKARFTLYELLTEWVLGWEGDEERAKEILRDNAATLKTYVFAAKKRGEFQFGQGKTSRTRKEGSFHERFDLDDFVLTLWYQKENEEIGRELDDEDDEDDED